MGRLELEAPILRPFAGNASIYAAVQLTPIGFAQPRNDDEPPSMAATYLVDTAVNRHGPVTGQRHS